MSRVNLICPNCGAQVDFNWSSSVQSVCASCRSIVVRTDVDLKKVGEVSDLPNDTSPIQIGSEGQFHNRGFVVAGRILYQYENGGWNEWHIVFQDGTSGWLSDAQLEYAVSELFKDPGQIPFSEKINVGMPFRWSGTQYEVSSITRAHYKGVEGELPFEYWDKDECYFVDLRSNVGKFGTIDYSEEKPIVFVGEFSDFDSLKLKNLRQFDGWL